MFGNALRKYPAAVAAALILALAAGCGSSRPPARRSTTARTQSMTQPYTTPYTAAQTPGTAQTFAAPPPAYCPPEPAPGTLSATGKSVILDAGHGGHDEGTSHFGLREKDINLDITLRTAAILRARGVNVVMTRSTDQFIPLPERSAVANRCPNATLVSIHTNAAPNNSAAAGIETFVLSNEFTDQERGRLVAERYRLNGQDSAQGRQALANLAQTSRSRGPALASSIQKTLCTRLGEADRGVKTKNLAVLRETYFGPAALVEVGFLTNPQTARSMANEQWRARAAEAIADGITTFLTSY